jgi:N6-adenosine-specific RNA methylase IME4
MKWTNDRQELPVGRIRVGPRHRKNLGDVAGLAASIRELGLLQPVAVTPDGKLVAGRRRLAAGQTLGWETVPVHIVHGLDDRLRLLRAERDENTARVPFLPTEAVSIGRDIEEQARQEAAARQEATRARKGEKVGRNGAAQGGANLAPPSDPTANGKSRDKVASAVGMSHGSYAKAREVVEAAEADPQAFGDLPRLMDETGRVDRAYRELRRRRHGATLLHAPLPPGRYRLLLADPPWPFEFTETDSRRVDNHYPPMALDAIKALGVPAAGHAILFLWAPAPKNGEALEVMRAWGFTYRSQFVWVKDRVGMGYWCRGQHELLLVGVRGDFPTPEPGRRFPSVIRAPRTRHSEKPAAVYDMLESMYPQFTEADRVDLFARAKRPGWTAWGNECPNGDTDLRPLAWRVPVVDEGLLAAALAEPGH